MTTTSILSLFETDKSQRESFCVDLIERLESGHVDPLTVHLQVKCMESIIKMLNENSVYKSMVLDASEKQGGKSFQFHNAKFEIKEVGAKYDFTKCGDSQWEQLNSQLEALKLQLKARENFLKTVPVKGIELLNDQTGELEMIYPPSKSSTTSVAVTLQ